MSNPKVIDEASNSDESSSAPSSTATETAGQTKDGSESSSSFSLAKSETRAVMRSKIVVLVVIAVAAAAVGTATYFFTRQEETDQFSAQFYDYSNEIIDLVHQEARNIFDVVDELSATITSYSSATNVSWPYLTVPHFEIRGLKSNGLSKAIQVTFAPLVKRENRSQWEEYALQNQGWLNESLAMQAELAEAEGQRHLAFEVPEPIPNQIWRFVDGDFGEHVVEEENYQGVTDVGPGNYAPVWQMSPAPSDSSVINFDLLSHPVFRRIYHGMYESRLPVLSESMDLSFLYDSAVHDDSEHPHSFLMAPVLPAFKAGLHERDDIRGLLVVILPWDSYFTNILPKGVNGFVIVLHDSCGEHFTYELNGPEAVFLGHGDLHDPRYSRMEMDTEFAPFLKHNFSDANEHCEYDLRIFPSSAVEAPFRTYKPAVYTAVVIAVFICTAAVFIMYDILVQRRQDKVMATAKRTNAIVSSLFPANVRDRILKDAEEQAEQELSKKKNAFGFAAQKDKLKDFLDEDMKDDQATKTFDSKPIADLFPHTTVLFADIVGFTAWSSVREPTQVFTLLETIYNAFDEIAHRRRVFKVETVGDCYVAVTGLPDPRKDHAVVMARFARDCLKTMNDLTKRLEESLGPDTGDLSMRFGLHSGPVTAGVLRGDKSRFQLFGDTVNTAARMESTGKMNKIHISQETADLLIEAGKAHWVDEREDVVIAKGKGAMATYWLTIKQQSASSTRSGSTNESEENTEHGDDEKIKSAGANATVSKPTPKTEQASSTKIFEEKIQRLVNWNTDVLARLLKQVIARRMASTKNGETSGSETPTLERVGDLMVLDEVCETIPLPEFDAEAARKQADPESIKLDSAVFDQLRDYVSTVASLYRDNPFHNFEHASHVTMSVVKLLSRIVAPDAATLGMDEKGRAQASKQIASTLHDHTYGITSDPLTQFACVFAGLIHDVDHSGVPNATLVKENAFVSQVYKGKSVAEQNSVDLAWELLMDDCFSALRTAIYTNDSELKHFRRLLVNSVMATDIVDGHLKKLRNDRWEKAFQEAPTQESENDSRNRKATIVIEHLIQASDVAHTMQHWHVYLKWNERFFHECYQAYRDGRAEKDPSENWYQGEIGFFDFYIIPLARKLKDCGVFGVSSDEYLNYAVKNRREWEQRGQEVVSKFVEKYREQYSGYVAPVQEEQCPTEEEESESEAQLSVTEERIMKALHRTSNRASSALNED